MHAVENAPRQIASKDTSYLGMGEFYGGQRLVRYGIALGVAAAVLSLIAGIVSYRSSREAHLKSLTRFNSIVANQLSRELQVLGPAGTSSEQVAYVLRCWNQIPETELNAYVCVIGPDAKLLAHSSRPEKVGSDVAGVRLSNPDSTIPGLIESQNDWVGENVNLAGRRQIAAYSYNPKLHGLIVVHTPASTYEADIRAAAMPWAVGFGLATFALWPVCLGLMVVAFRRSSHATTLAQRRLHDRFSELDSLYRTTPVGLCLMDTNLRFVRINERMAAINGFTAEQHIGRQLAELIPDIAERVIETYQQVIDTGKDVSEFDVTREVAGDTHYFRVSYHAVLDDDNKVIGVGTVEQDVTKERISQFQRERHHQELAHASRLSTMGELVAGITHEINQPLSAISNFSAACRNLLEKEGDFSIETVRNWLERIADESMRCGEIIRRLRKFVNKGEQSLAKVNLNNVVSDSLSLIESDTNYSDIEIQCHLPDTPTFADANDVLLQQVIVNLVRNACDATENQPHRVVKIELNADDGIATFAIIDNGVGVQPGQQDHLFDAFFTTKESGMGMGLAISKTIMEAHGGDLRFDTSVTAGARFVVELPSSQAIPKFDGAA